MTVLFTIIALRIHMLPGQLALSSLLYTYNDADKNMKYMTEQR